eukprot:TRINITY_DN8618_c0_g1_i1.p1 TRINITY_DN8618_c0_g1~~TRINITY_DN8618_c0_g1_i1.p1  ORF type:complete len:499 (+),score=94.35 TRINITY_DN8618_c0_g1_i1:44-1498(+)
MTTYYSPSKNYLNSPYGTPQKKSIPSSIYTSTRSLTPQPTRRHTPVIEKNTTPSSPSPYRQVTSSPAKRLFDSPTSDRFIPMRSPHESGLANYRLTKDIQESTDAQELVYKKKLADSLFAESTEGSVLRYHKKEIKSENVNEKIRNFYSNCSPRKKTKPRAIPTIPYKILDAPGLSDNYYLNLLDWGKNNVIAVALAGTVYLWNADTAEVNMLCTLRSPITSVSWNSSNTLAIGTADAEILLWDARRMAQVSTIKDHTARVSSLSWNGNLLSSGSRDANILNHDVRTSEVVSQWDNHSQEVVGLTWSPDGTQLASGGNDNILNIWNPKSDGVEHSFRQHTAAVKALAWCPFKSNVLASGGGASDRTIKFWNTASGTCQDSIYTGSQVCSLKWSSNYKELISSHGYPENQLSVWKYPTMEKVADLVGHEVRALFMTMSPDGKTVASAAGTGDETIRFWRAFDTCSDHNASSVSFSSSLMKGMHIR